jgi:hypothetical protein
MSVVDAAGPERQATQAQQAPDARQASHARVWAAIAAAAAIVPFASGLSGSRIFYIRDLSLHFWERFLWLRRTLWSGEWPLWDPYLAAGQSATADGLHQMFLLPVLLLRLAGSEVLSFNLWVLLPFPVAALGAWVLFSRRFAAPAAALGAIAFAVCGPTVSSGNFPNMSWSVAAMPWVVAAADRLAMTPSPRAAAWLALAVAFEALASEPVTLYATLATTIVFAIWVAVPAPMPMAVRVRRLALVSGAIGLGVLLAAIQLVPMGLAARAAERASEVGQRYGGNLWSLQPLALVETIALHLFGNYFDVQSVTQAPWMEALNTGREPFFFSLYLGVPLLATALFGALSARDRRWTTFWAVAGAAAVIGAFGSYTPIYPFLRSHLPLLASFRFPVKYLVVFALAVAACAAAGADTLVSAIAGLEDPRSARARSVTLAALLALALTAAVAAAGCLYARDSAAAVIHAIAVSVRCRDPLRATEAMLLTLPRLAAIVTILSLAAAGLLAIGSRGQRGAALASYSLLALVAGDLLVHAHGLNPAFDPSYLARPEWLAFTAPDPDGRFYVGGKRDGTLDARDMDSSRAFVNPPGLIGSASRAALSAQAVFYPGAFRAREMVSFDLPVLWPLPIRSTLEHFFEASPEERDRFLNRTGVRYRILNDRLADGHAPLTKIPYFYDASLYDWDSGVTPRVNVVSQVLVVPNVPSQILSLFEPGWDSRTMAIAERAVSAAGVAGAPVAPSATIDAEGANWVRVRAGADADGGLLVLLDTYDEHWRARVDGTPAEIVRTDGLFRGVHLKPGPHTVEFVYRPLPFYQGAAISALALLAWLGLVTRRSAVTGGASSL